jgi:hypothetical protein
MLLAMTAMLSFTQVGVDSSYAASVLPGLMVMGLGLGLVMAPSMNGATTGVGEADAGVASAMVNTSQQVGGSIGTALLSTISASAVTSFAAGKVATPGLAAEAAVHGYTTAFWWSAAIFAVGAITSGLLLKSGVQHADPQAQPALAH